MHLHKKLRLFALTIIVLTGVNGCAAIPIVVQQGSWFASGVSYIATHKGPSDHALSVVMNMDCSLLRILKRDPVCQDKEILPYTALVSKDAADYF